MIDSEIDSLKDLNNFRSAPRLSINQSKRLLKELAGYIDNADWLTTGIMAPSSEVAIKVIREIESFFSWSKMNLATKPNDAGPVFLKANQNTGDIHIRIEHGLGEGILMSCQHLDEQKDADTFGPFPLDFFKENNNP